MNGNERPIVSIIIPCYNCAPWIERCLAAIESQTYTNFEVICVDDCSTDDTYSIVNDYMSHTTMCMRLMKNNINSGPAISRNNAIKGALGEWIAFCDSDDYYESTFIEEMLEHATKENADVAMCEYRKIFESGKASKDVHYLSDLDQTSSVEDVFVYSKSALWLLLIKKHLLDENSIPNLRNGEDIACVPCIESCAGKISIVKKVLYNYYIRDMSSSHRPSKTIYKSLCSAYDYIEQHFSGDYPDVLEYIGIRTILYGATINAFKARVSTKEIKDFLKKFCIRYPKWYENKYIRTQSKIKRLYLKTLQYKMYAVCRIFAYIHLKMST